MDDSEKCVAIVLFVLFSVLTRHFGLWELDDFESALIFLCRFLFIDGKKLRDCVVFLLLFC